MTVSGDPAFGGPAIVVDAVVHPYNLSPGNQNPAAMSQLESVHASHCRYTGDPGSPFALTRAEFFSDFSFDVLAEALGLWRGRALADVPPFALVTTAMRIRLMSAPASLSRSRTSI